MKTVTVQIGNSDDKLTQSQWSKFVDKVHTTISTFAQQVHFSAPSHGDAPWQNFCCVFVIYEEHIAPLKAHITDIRKDFSQDSAAWTEGDTAFI
jgi:hypothetical protein